MDSDTANAPVFLAVRHSGGLGRPRRLQHLRTSRIRWLGRRSRRLHTVERRRRAPLAFLSRPLGPSRLALHMDRTSHSGPLADLSRARCVGR